MKKRVLNTKFIQKAFISIIIILLLSFAVPIKSHAGIGGILLDPLFDLGGTILDAIVGGLQMFLVDGQFNNSSDSSGLNFFMAEPEDFMSKVDSEYSEFKYTGTEKNAKEKIKESELDSSFSGGETYNIPLLKYTPEKIFSGKIPALDINFVSPHDWSDEENGTEMNNRSITQGLHDTIASWYVALRNLAIVGLMIVLIYVGIRIVISSTASDKSKYKQMLMDWLIALCLLFTLHYIMTFTTTIVTEITTAISGTTEENNGNNISVQVVDDSDSSTGTEFNTDLMGLIRFKMQSPTVGLKVLYFIFYLAMVIYTCLFTFAYLKRVLVMAFLTLIAPMVALTYPIDKIRDGKAQAFDMWFKEYIFNALLQPFHLIIYTIFVGSAISLAASNPIYAIIALAFLTPAEKLLRKFFGFEKASTAGALGTFASVAGGAAAFNMVSRALGGKKGGAPVKGKSNIKTKKGIEGDVPSLTKALGGPKDSGDTSEEVSSSENTGETSTGGGGERPGIGFSRTQNNSYGGEPESTPIFGEESGLVTPNSTLASTEGMSRTPSGLYYPTQIEQSRRASIGGEDGSSRTTPTSSPNQPTSSGTQRNIQSTSSQSSTERKPWQSGADDERGLGQYFGDIGKYGAGKVGGFVGGIMREDAAKLADSARNAKIRLSNSPVGNVGRKIAGSSVGKGVASAGGKLTRTVGNGVKKVRDIAPIKPITNTAKGALNVAKKTGIAAGKGALNVAGRVAAAAPGAAFGLAAGIAGDELSDIFKYTAAGAALSAATLPGIGGSVGSFISDAYNEGAHGTDTLVKAQEKAYVKSTEYDDLYKQEFRHSDGSDISKQELKARKQQGSYYAARGIEGEDVIKAVAMEDKIKKELQSQPNAQDTDVDAQAQAQAARLMKIAKKYDSKDLRDNETVQKLTNSLQNELINGGFGKKDAQMQAERVVTYIKEARGVKDTVKK